MLESDILILRFPAPDIPLSENESRRMHWAARRRRTDPWKEAAQSAWLFARKTPEGKFVARRPAAVLVWIPFLQRRRRDPHNFVSTIVKPIVDGLTDHYEKVPPGRMVRTFEGIWPDDTPEWVEAREPRLYGGIDCVVEILPRLVDPPRHPPLSDLKRQADAIEEAGRRLRDRLDGA